MTGTSLSAVQVIASLDRAAAGPSYSVRRLAEGLAAQGVASAIMCTRSGSDMPVAGVPVRAFPQDGAGLPVVRRFHASSRLRSELQRVVGEGAILHAHGLWTLPNLYPGWASWQSGRPYLVSPRGMLGPAALQFSRWQKQAVWHLAQKRVVQRATCLHATSRQECEEFRSLGLTNPVAIIPNGVDLPEAAEVTAAKARRSPARRTLLHLGRIHPKKGIDRLVEAWSVLEPDFPDWDLRIVGPSEGGHAEALAVRAQALGLSRVTFEGSVFGPRKDAAYQEADLFVLPTLNENFGMVVAEALANGTPVICTQGAPWQGLDAEGAGWWIAHGVEALAASLRVALSMSRPTLDGMGQQGRHWMARDFSWERVASEMAEVYGWCLGRGERPATVEVSA